MLAGVLPELQDTEPLFMRRRVVITGLGCVTPLGHDPEGLWRSLTAGACGVGPITIFDASKFPVRIAAEVKDWDLRSVGLDPAAWEGQARQTRFAVGAALQATQSSGVGESIADPTRMGIYLGCGEIFPDFERFANSISGALDAAGFCPAEFTRQLSALCDSEHELAMEPGAAVCLLTGLLNAQGPVRNYTAACVSSSLAVGEAVEVIRHDEADVMFAGGAHSMIHPFGITGFHRLSTLSERNDDPRGAAQPFDRDREGFVIGEGGTVFCLEEYEHAKRRGANILAEVIGFASTHDAYRVTDPQPEGTQAARCMQMCLADANVATEDIDYINAHGSGTVANDKAETFAVKRVFGQQAYRIPISSIKAAVGHLTTACGALELLACVKAIQTNTVPPTINYHTPDPDCDLDYIANDARDVACRRVMKNSFGFGGQNVSLIVSSL